MTGQSSSQAATPVQWWKPALFFLVVIIGLWYVKWQPYYGKAFTAAETHSIGKSILAQADASPLKAAWDYAMVYFLAVWKAAVLGRLLGVADSGTHSARLAAAYLGQSRFQGTLLGTIFSLPGMMCTCCAAPVAAGMRRQQVSMGGRWHSDGQSVVKPGDAGVYGFVLGWGFAAIRLVAGLVMVLLIATLVQNGCVKHRKRRHRSKLTYRSRRAVFLAAGAGRYGRFFWSTIPVYILAVLVLGAARVWLFPHADGAVDNSLDVGGGDGGSRMLVCHSHGSRNSDCTNDDAGRYGNGSGAGIADDAPWR